MEHLVQYVQDEFVEKKSFPSFQAGDTITVYYEIREGEKVRTQFFKGVVIQIKGTGSTKTFTIRKISVFGCFCPEPPMGPGLSPAPRQGGVHHSTLACGS